MMSHKNCEQFLKIFDVEKSTNQQILNKEETVILLLKIISIISNTNWLKKIFCACWNQESS